MSNPIEHVYASGAKAMNTTVGATTIVDRTSTYVVDIHASAVRITSSAHGYLVGDSVHPTGLLIRGLSNYKDAVHRVLAVATNTLDIVTTEQFTSSDTPGGSETINPGYLAREKCKFLGFELHLGAASATSEDFEIHVDSVAGSSFDAKKYDYDMNGVQDISNMFDQAIVLNAGDMIYCTWANSNDRTWGLELIFEKLGA